MSHHHHHHHHLFLFLHLLVSLIPVFSDLAADRSALLRLQEAVGGQTLRWNTTAGSSPCNSWRGVVCNATTNRVVELRLPGSGLRGTLPPNSVGNLTELRVLSLRNNALSGQLPSDLASCTYLEDIHLSGNSFSGEIPDTFFTLTNLLRVNFAGNRFSGNLSTNFNNLINLRTLYLESNQLTGPIPDWNNLTNLRNFNVSFNIDVTGSIPSTLANFSDQSFLGTSLCGRPLPSCSSNGGNNLSDGAIAGIAIGSFAALLIILCVAFVLWKTYRSRKVLPHRSPAPRSPAGDIRTPDTEQYNWRNNEYLETKKESDGLVFLGKEDAVFSLQELLSASAEVMGKGTIGSTYKAYFESGIQVVVKRLKNVSVPEAEFRVKIEEVGSLLHRNLEPLRGYFYGTEEKLLVYRPMPKGSLAAALHSYGMSNQSLSLETRCRIAVGVASGIEYLHSVGSGTVHGNIRSSNVFITEDYEARVSEYGLARLVASSSSLNGYRAPEVLDTRVGSQKADVYGLGVLLLELLTGREPDGILTEEGVALPDWVQTVVEDKGTAAVIDPSLIGREESEDQVVELLLVALSCTSRQPSGRPSAADVVRRLRKICD
ncbi:probable inactive receptor kinase At1g48480 [Salvia hispanica]|uniref:probable inactive receptor kinase At1g48480 n=1 Tax=Salvia hispanica TaxID=49212 RepID=UPI002008FA96|nr:probable inactive receptor kinase At1g48480 [Salvia hispanica]